MILNWLSCTCRPRSLLLGILFPLLHPWGFPCNLQYTSLVWWDLWQLLHHSLYLSLIFFPLLCCPLVRVDTGLMLTNAEFSMLGLSIMTDYLLSSLPTSFYTCLTYGSVFSPRIQLWTRSSLDLDPPKNQMPSPFQVSAWTSHYLLDISKHSPDRYLTLIKVD